MIDLYFCEFLWRNKIKNNELFNVFFKYISEFSVFKSILFERYLHNFFQHNYISKQIHLLEIITNSNKIYGIELRGRVCWREYSI